MRRIKILKRQLAPMSTERALFNIIKKGGSSKCFIWNSQLWTVMQARDEWEKCLLIMPCGEFGVIRFYGGPPGGAKWYDGTMLSMFCDLIMFDENTQTWSAEKKLSA